MTAPSTFGTDVLANYADLQEARNMEWAVRWPVEGLLTIDQDVDGFFEMAWRRIFGGGAARLGLFARLRDFPFPLPWLSFVLAAPAAFASKSSWCFLKARLGVTLTCRLVCQNPSHCTSSSVSSTPRVVIKVNAPKSFLSRGRRRSAASTMSALVVVPGETFTSTWSMSSPTFPSSFRNAKPIVLILLEVDPALDFNFDATPD